jgi:UDP-N-acetylglucosamine 2-epimerase
MGFQEQILIQVAKKFQTSVILLQHGINFDDKAAFEANQFLGVIPNHSDKIAVWGQVDKKYLEECKIPLKKIQIIGNPYFDKLFEENKQTLAENKGFVLLAAQSPNVGSFVIDAEIKTMEKYLEAIRTICKTVLKTDKELVIKLHPDPSELDITPFVKKIDPKIQVIKTGSISDLVRSCDTLVTIDISTVTLEAQIFEKPVISVSVKNYNIGDDNCSFFKSKSCIRTELQNFDMNFNRLLQDQEFKHETINRGKKYVNDCLSNQGNASRKLLEFSTKINLEN